MSVKDKIVTIKDCLAKNELKIQEYVIQDDKAHPFAVICPGGGYSMVCSSREGKPYAKYLNSKGFSAFVVTYRCKKKGRYPAPMDDLALAIKTIMDRSEELGLDKSNYSVWGSSAGGHLAASFGTDRMGYVKYGLPKPRAVVLVYPVITMGDMTHKGSRVNLLGKNPDEKMVELTSVERQITHNYPPCFIWCGNEDKIVSPENSRILDAALKVCGIRHEFEIYSGVGHGVGLGKGLACEGWIEKAITFWMA